MMRRRWMILVGIIFILALGIGLTLGLWDYHHPFSWPDLPPLEYGWPEADHILQVLPSDASFDFLNLERLRQNDDGWLQWKQGREEFLYGQSWDIIDSWCQYWFHGSDGCIHSLSLSHGRFDSASVASVLDQGCSSTYEYRCIRIWRGDQESMALVNGIMITGDETHVQRCLDVAQGESPSAFDNDSVRGLLGHLIRGNEFSFMPLSGCGGTTANCVYGEASTVVDDWGIETDVYGYYDPEAAKAGALEVQRNIGPNDSDQVRRKVERDGVYVVITAVRRSEQHVDPVI